MNWKPILNTLLFACAPLAGICANPTASDRQDLNPSLLCSDFIISTCNDAICLSRKKSHLIAAQARDIKISPTNRLEEVGVFEFDDLAEESASRLTGKPQSGKVILDSYGWPHPVVSDSLGPVSMLSAADLQCTDESNGQRDKICHVTVAKMDDKNMTSRVLHISSVTSSGGKALLTTEEARSAAHCAAAYRFSK